MATLREALNYAAKNPNSDFAKFLTQRIQSGEADTEARQAGIDLTPIKSSIKQTPEEKQPGFFERVGGQFQEAGQKIIGNIQQGALNVAQSVTAGQQGRFGEAAKFAVKAAVEPALRTVGDVAGAAFAPITEAPVIKPAIEKAGETIAQIPALQPVIKGLSDLAQKYPETARDIESLFNISIITGLPMLERPIGAATGKVATKTGRVLEESGLASAKAARETFAKDLVMPIRDKAVRTAQVGRTTETGSGIFKRSIIEPTTLEKNAIAEVSKIPEVAAAKTFQQNFNIISKANVVKAEKLVSDIEANNFLIPRKEVIARLNNAAANLADNPVIVGDAEKTAQRLIDGARKIINENEGTGAGLLKARKEFDAWVLSQKPKAFDATSENAFSIANREVRQTINDLLEQKAPDLGIKQSLREQSALYYALDNIAPKAAEEADTAILRAMQNVSKALGTKNKAVQAIAAMVGIGGLGAAATFAPAAAVLGTTGFVLYQGGKLILKPEVRIAIGKLLQTSGKLLGSEDKAVLEKILEEFSP